MQQEYEGEIREIIAKTVCAKGKKRFVKEHQLCPDHRPEHILGYWVGNHHYSAKSFHDSVVITGKYDVTVWYSYEDHSKTDLCKQTFNYSEQIALGEVEGRLEKDEEVLVCERIEPTCNLAKIAGENIKFGVETAFTVEIIGEAKMIVVAYPPGILGENEDDEDYDEELNRDDYEDEDEEENEDGNENEADDEEDYEDQEDNEEENEE
ncbi:MAG: outer spore coat protein CotE [Clostridia bacterium]|nr:outer spore coat protein CotE [Clostridia bacterium]